VKNNNLEIKNDHVLFVDFNHKANIETDSNGNQYFEIINHYADTTFVFGQEDQAIKAIIDGFADGLIERNDNYCSGLVPVKFIDEKYGKKVRKQTLENFENVKFNYCINLLVNLEDGIYSIPITQNNTSTFKTMQLILSPTKTKQLCFDTRQDAEQFISTLEQELEQELQTITEENIIKFAQKYNNHVFLNMIAGKKTKIWEFSITANMIY